MGLLDIIKNLFGGASDAATAAAGAAEEAVSGKPANTVRPAGAQAAADDGDEDEEDDSSDDGDDGDDGDGDDEPPDFGGWNPDDQEEFWYRAFVIEDGQARGPRETAEALKRFGLADEEQFNRVRSSFHARHGADQGFMQKAMNARMKQTQEKMSAAAAGNKLLEPIDGVSIEVWATIAARKAGMQGQPMEAQIKMMAEYSMDEARYQKADAAWQARMRAQDDPMGAAAVATEFGKYFGLAQQGKFGAAGAAGAKGLGLDGKSAAVQGAEPCSFERYCEIMAAQGVWANQGRDVTAMLKQTFGLTPLDWSNLGGYWSGKMMADIALASKMGEYDAKYRARYEAAAGPGADDDLGV